MDWALDFKAKGHQFNSQSGHMPGLWVCSGGHVRGDHTLMFLSLFFSLPFPLSKNKQNLFKNNKNRLKAICPTFSLKQDIILILLGSKKPAICFRKRQYNFEGYLIYNDLWKLIWNKDWWMFLLTRCAETYEIHGELSQSLFFFLLICWCGRLYFWVL